MTLNITDWLADFCADADVEVAEIGATATQLAQLEQDLGIPLSASHKDCLQIWDGAADFDSWQILSIAEIRDGVKYWGFQAGESKVGGADYPFLYRAKPLALLPFAQPLESADLFCFDTREFRDGEYAIVKYDHEVGDVDKKYPSFAAFLQDRALDMTEDLEYFMGELEDDEVAERICEEWAHRLR